MALRPEATACQKMALRPEDTGLTGPAGYGVSSFLSPYDRNYGPCLSSFITP
jgi:hypothetical protein